MVQIKKKQFSVTLTETWYGYKFKWTDIFLPVCYRGIWNLNQRFYFGIKKQTTSIVLALDKPIEEICDNFSHGNKKDIRRAEKEGIQCSFHTDIKEFVECYNDFARRRQIPQLDINRIKDIETDKWKFSHAVLNGQVLAFHSYLEDKETGIVRAMEGGSMRLNDNYPQKQTALASVLLNCHDIKYYKEQGFRYYDFGGWNDVPGVLEFKKSFGGQPIDVLNFFSYPYYLKEKLKVFFQKK